MFTQQDTLEKLLFIHYTWVYGSICCKNMFIFKWKAQFFINQLLFFFTFKGTLHLCTMTTLAVLHGKKKKSSSA